MDETPASRTPSLFGPAEGLSEPSSPAPSGSEPLAARMRPATLGELLGQQALLGPGSLLRRAIEMDSLFSMVLWGPPGCGKSTLAHIIARTTSGAFENLSAVTAGIADVRDVIRRARERWRTGRRRTILFVDEIHRWNKAQQDALLPHVEAGTLVLIGATTENPYFEVNAPLLSRARVFRLEPLSDEDLRKAVRRALEDRERGLGCTGLALADDALDHLVQKSAGDARVALNALEAAADAVTGRQSDERIITLPDIEEALQSRVLRYDKGADEHYDTISAFIKSVRGSDADAAVYWLAKMLAAGEDPRFIARRLVILAAEDVGNADPQGLVLASAAAQAVMFVGMPEAQLVLAQAATYLATAPKSNASLLALVRAKAEIEEHGAAPVPLRLRNEAHPGLRGHGYGSGYCYPHDTPMELVGQVYLPDTVQGRPYYVAPQSSLRLVGPGRVLRVRWRERGQEHEVRVDAQVDELLVEVAPPDDPPASSEPAG